MRERAARALPRSLPVPRGPDAHGPPLSHLWQAVANVGMTKEEIIKNTTLSINFLVSLLKKSWQNVGALYIKSSMGPSHQVCLARGGTRLTAYPVSASGDFATPPPPPVPSRQVYY